MRGMRFSVLGPLEVTGPDGPMALGGPRQRAVLAMLVIHAGQEVPTSRLIDGVWAEAPPPTAERTLHAYVARLRGLLEPDRAAGATPTLLTRTTLGYRLHLRPGEVDGLALEGAVAGARLRRASGDVAGAAVQLQTALASWRGPALGDLRAFPALNAAAERLERLRGDAVAELVDAELQLGRHTDLLPHLAGLVEESPFDERLWSALALAQYRSRRQADALDTVRRARRTLVTELGIEPGTELRALQQAILANDPALDTSAQSAAVLDLPHPGLEGREDQLRVMRAAWSLCCAGHGGSIVLTGPQGIGRSRLLHAFAAEVHAAGGRLVEWHHGDGPNRADKPGTDVATMVLADDVNAATTAEFSDLLHWVDAAGEQPLLVVLTIRDGYVSPELGALLARIDPTGERSIRLTRLEPDQIAKVATSYVGAAKALDVAANVAKDSAGIPAQVHAQIEAFAGTTLRRAASDYISAASADWSGARRGEAELVSSLLELSAVESAATVARALATGPPACPYPGLAPFDALAAAFFAGREELVAVGVARLAIAGSLLVVGASGVGKSSLVRAGIIPALLSGAVPGSDHWRIDLVTPTLVGPAFSGRGPRPDLLVVDQVEELLGLDPPARADFITGLLRVKHDGGRVVLVARSDQYPAVANERRLDELVAAPQLLVGALTDAQLFRAIQIPIRRAGMDCEEGLVTAIVEDVSGELGALPLLSTTMRELWDLCPSGVLTLGAYGQLGGIRNAVARLAERTYSTFDGGEREATRELLLRMASPGEGGAVVRGFVDVAAIGPVGPTRIAFDRLIADRLVTVDEDHASVAHEALFAHWPRLAAWLDADSDTRSQRARVGQSARSWADGGRLAADLLRGPRLAAALELSRDRPELVSAEEADFIRASETADSHERLDLMQRLRQQHVSNRRLRLLIGFAAVAFLVATVAAGTALRAQRTADTAATQSLARGLGAQALTVQRLDLSLLLAAQSAALDPGVAAHSALLAALARAPQALHVFVGTGQRLDTVTVGGPGPTVISIDRSPAAEAINLATGVARAVRDPSMYVSAAALSASGPLLALGGGDRANPSGQVGPGHITFLDGATMKPSGRTIVTSSQVEALRFDGGADRLAALLDSGETDVFDVATGARVWSGKGTRTPFATTVDFSTSGQYLTVNAPAVLWRVGAGSVNPIPLNGDRAAIRADGALLAVAAGPTVRLVRRVGLTTVRQLDSFATPVQTLA
ncbi:MAG: BTAD domain-containing putative transcriptional regulator, partial [Nostocoides sp.]